ncbi:MAG: LacI family DNA-binding transcriptional regulator [Chloroflexi bacterium]|nr:LacI family DNA-binding transcriptional regulator [Chloroflexota bacterium]
MSVHNRQAPGQQARTLEEVARLAGVSRNTVSLAIRDDPRVNPRTRERVLGIVRETGYRPNHAARVLAARKSSTIGLVHFGNMPEADSYYDPMIAGIHHALGPAGYDLLLVSPRRATNGLDLLEPAMTGRVDGLVAIGTRTDRAAIASAVAHGARIVHIGRRDFGDVRVPYVTADEVGGMERALRHLREHGHSRIAVVGEDVTLEPTRDKIEACRKLLAEGGGAEADAVIVEAPPYDPARVRAAARMLVERGVTAAVTTRDPLSVALVRALAEAGRSVPADFAVIGYGNLEWTPLTEPPLTSISPPRFNMGYAAGRMVIDLVEGRPVPTARVLPARLTIRRSCGCSWSPLDEGREIFEWLRR